MTLTDLLTWARRVAAGAPHLSTATATDAAITVLELLSESAPCGWEEPRLFVDPDLDPIDIPRSWSGLVTADDARALARMLLRAADEAEQ